VGTGSDTFISAFIFDPRLTVNPVDAGCLVSDSRCPSARSAQVQRETVSDSVIFATRCRRHLDVAINTRASLQSLVARYNRCRHRPDHFQKEPGMSVTQPLILQRHQLSVTDYYRMAQAGILGEGDRCELIDGEIIDMAPIGSEHASTVKRLLRQFQQAVGSSAIVSIQDPVRLDTHNEPQPDIALLRYRDDFYRHAHPTPEDVLLIVEVADASLRYDLEVKLPLYARCGVPEVWIVNLQDGRVEIFREPEGHRYREAIHPDRNETIAPLALPDCSVKLGSLL
jgi:hypothetical protein